MQKFFSSDLPRRKYLNYLPVVILLSLVVFLTAAKVNQSSAGVYENPKTGQGIFGADRPIRSDEWLVRLPWLLSQEARDFDTKMVTAGTHEPAITYDLPSKDFALVTKPHLLPYFVFDINRAIAAEWWILIFGSAIATYLLLVSLGVRRSLSFPLSLFMAFSPGLHWWTVNSSFSIVLYGALGGAVFIRALQAEKTSKCIALSLLAGWLFSCAAVVLYPPFQIPTLVLIALLLLVEMRSRYSSDRQKSIYVVVISGIIFLTLTTAFLIIYGDGLSATATTVYPGSRRSTSGDINLASLFGVPFDLFASRSVSGVVNGLNQSENASTFLLALPVLFLLPFRSGAHQVLESQRQFLCVATAWFVVLLAWMFLPLPDIFGKATLLNRVPPDRIKPSLSFVCVVVVALFLDKYIDSFSRKQRLIAVAYFGVITLITGTYYSVNDIQLSNSDIFKYGLLWFIPTVLIFCFSKRIGLWALVLVALFTSLNINPIHRSVRPLYENSIRSEILRVDPLLSENWVTFSGSPQIRGLMVASGAQVMSAVSPYPDNLFWKQFDPESRFKDQWNRYGHVQFVSIKGPTRIVSTQADVITVEIDICSVLNSKTLLIESAIEALPCLEKIGEAEYQGRIWKIFRKS